MSWLTPHIPELPDHYVPWTRKELLVAGIVALVVVATLGITVIAPAEFATDPTGIGERLRLTELESPPHPPEEPGAPTINVTPLAEFPYQWPLTNVLYHDDEGTLAVGETATINVDVPLLNVTEVTAYIAWQDEAVFGDPQPDTFTVALAGPAGTSSATASNDGAAGSATTSVTASTVPAEGNVSATDAAQAISMIRASNPGQTDGTGTWTITITLDEVADLVGDDGNAWVLQVYVETFDLALGDERPTPIQEVTVTLDLPGGGAWTEYKVAIAEGATLTYAWTATDDIDWDLHGLDTDTRMETSHRTGTSDGDAGQLLVPFNGLHGWAMRNVGQADVAVTLTLRGPFELLD